MESDTKESYIGSLFWSLVRPCTQCFGAVGVLFGKTEEGPVQLVEELNVFNAEFSEDEEEIGQQRQKHQRQ